MKNSNILLDEFKNFYDQFNLLTEKVLNTNNSNKEKNTTGQKKTIIVENVIVKQLKRSIKTSIDNLKIKNDENNNAIKKYDNELKSLFPKSNKNNWVYNNIIDYKIFIKNVYI